MKIPPVPVFGPGRTHEQDLLPQHFPVLLGTAPGPVDKTYGVASPSTRCCNAPTATGSRGWPCLLLTLSRPFLPRRQRDLWDQHSGTTRDHGPQTLARSFVFSFFFSGPTTVDDFPQGKSRGPAMRPRFSCPNRSQQLLLFSCRPCFFWTAGQGWTSLYAMKLDQPTPSAFSRPLSHMGPTLAWLFAK